MATPATDNNTTVRTEVTFAKDKDRKSTSTGSIKDSAEIRYPRIKEMKAKGPTKVISASKDILFRLPSSFPYLTPTSIVPLNHLTLCLKKLVMDAGYSCQDRTSEAYFIL